MRGDVPPPPGAPARPDDNRQRTLLAGDRTVLAWYRTAFGAYGLAIGLGSIVPGVTTRESVAYRAAGVAFAVLGLVAALLGIRQYLTFEHGAGLVRVPWANRWAVIGFGLLVALLGLIIGLLIAVGG
jgi:uncharacterized membrane protein YidH (DUF202 family)